MRLESLSAGRPRAHPDGFVTGFGKAPVAGPARLGRGNLEGDGQADLSWHGGADMAVLAYAAAHYPRWREELAWPSLPHGGFGENLTVLGASEEDACIGDVWRAGSALLQIASPRKPCRVIDRYWRRPGLVRLVERTGRSGWYLRVLEEGVLEAGAEIGLVARPHPQWTVARAARVARARKKDRSEAAALAEVQALAARWRAYLRGQARV